MLASIDARPEYSQSHPSQGLSRMLVGHLAIGARVEQQWADMTTLHVLDFPNKKRVITSLVCVHHPGDHMSNCPFQQRNALLLNESDFKSVYRATSKMTAQPLLIVGEYTHSVKTVRAKQLVHLGIMADRDQHQWWIQ